MRGGNRAENRVRAPSEGGVPPRGYNRLGDAADKPFRRRLRYLGGRTESPDPRGTQRGRETGPEGLICSSASPIGLAGWSSSPRKRPAFSTTTTSAPSTSSSA